MKKIINAPERFVDETIEGILLAHPDRLDCAEGNPRCIIRKNAGKKKKVGIASGGGSGHLPLFLGYVGSGLLDGCSVGGVFQSPSADNMFTVTKAVDSGMGVLYIFGNYSGDKMNFTMAAEMADLEGIRVERVTGCDDVASSPKGEEEKRRGIAGIFFVYKVAGALAEEGASLEQVRDIAAKANSRVRTMGVALSPCTIPEVGKPNFVIGDGDMEIGMGIHGEPGVRREALKTADAIADRMMDQIFADYQYSKGDEVAVLVNGLGATPKEELYILYRRVAQRLTDRGITVIKTYVGEFATSMEMSGCSVSVFHLDAELKKHLLAPASTPFFEQA
ncbi:MAG: dihydroxyacetone kinase subunit DhaK [Spirochaetales bacterium]|jgi:dihydroxyacetone kinase-like protein|nr:dihydroxyacetone kinase subunit DhaK [Spirochaetales bacterium]